MSASAAAAPVPAPEDPRAHVYRGLLNDGPRLVSAILNDIALGIESDFAFAPDGKQRDAYLACADRLRRRAEELVEDEDRESPSARGKKVR